MQTLRWFLVLPVGAAGIVLGLAISIALMALAERFCPPELFISGKCIATWFPAAESAAICVGSALGAFAVVALPSAIAPTWKKQVAVSALLAGALFAFFALGARADSLLPLGFAFASGLSAVALIFANSRVRLNPVLQRTASPPAERER